MWTKSVTPWRSRVARGFTSATLFHGAPLEDAPVSEISLRLLEHEGGTRMEIRMTFETRQDMERIVDMGTVEALTQGVSRMDALLTP